MPHRSFRPFFDEFSPSTFCNWDNNGFFNAPMTVPSVNIQETADDFEVELARPGLEKKDFKIELEGSRLTISSKKEHSDDQRENGYSCREFN